MSTSSGITTYSPTTNANAYGTANSSDTISQNQFLNLLVTQLQNQDPTNPESDEDFASQMAQFQSLTQMTDMNTTTTNQYAASLIGATVTTDLTDGSGAAITGQVTGATISSSGAVTVTVGGRQIDLSDITGVQPTSMTS
jgi:flagellar basal-body rod modification protein FlgD